MLYTLELKIKTPATNLTLTQSSQRLGVYVLMELQPDTYA